MPDVFLLTLKTWEGKNAIVKIEENYGDLFAFEYKLPEIKDEKDRDKEFEFVVVITYESPKYKVRVNKAIKELGDLINSIV